MSSAPLANDLQISASFSASAVVNPAASDAATSIVLPFPPSSGFLGQATFRVASVPADLRMTVSYTSEPIAELAAFAAPRLPVIYACFSVNHLLDVIGEPQFTFRLPRSFATSGVIYYLAIEQSGKWTDGYGGPGTIVASATSAAISIDGRFGFVIPANGIVCAALYGRSINAPRPIPATPVPTPIPATPGPPPIPATPAPTPIPATPAPRASPGTLVVTAVPIAVRGGAVALTVGATDTLTIAAADAPATTATTCGSGSVATLRGSGASFVLTGTAAGTCTVTLTNAAGKTNIISVTVAALGPMTLSPASLTLKGAGVSQLVTTTESGYTGAFSETDTCSGIATVSPTSNSGSSATYNVTSVASGSCSVVVTDAVGHSATSVVGVTVFGLVIQSKTRQQ